MPVFVGLQKNTYTMNAPILLFIALFTCLSFLSVGQDCDALTKRGVIRKMGPTRLGMGQINLANHGDTDIDYFVIEQQDTTYKVNIQKGTLTLPDESNARGVVLTFSDGFRLERPMQKVAIKARGGGYKLNVECPINRAELAVLGRQKLASITLINATGEVDSMLAGSILEMVPCLLK